MKISRKWRFAVVEEGALRVMRIGNWVQYRRDEYVFWDWDPIPEEVDEKESAA